MNHEKLRVYQQLVALAADVAKKVATWPRGHGYLCDQVKRAIASAALTLAEGNGKRSSSAERRRFFEISLGSISEVGACLDLAVAFGLLSRREVESFKSRLKEAYVKIGALP